MSALFFGSVRANLFSGKLTNEQVDGMNAILKAFDDAGVTDNRERAYMLATAYHETSRTMQPIKEYGGYNYYTRMYDITGARPAMARANGNATKGDGAKYCGRGYVQLTWRNNYERAGLKICVDLVNNPDLAMQPAIAARIMIEGMRDGWFTGRALRHYITPSSCDFTACRKIINGKDKDGLIAAYAGKFLAALNKT